MAWRQFSFHYKQVYEGGYRYLDRCGEFIVSAEEQLGFMPEDINVSGAKLIIPEYGISAVADTVQLGIIQEFVSDDNGERFIDVCTRLSALFSKCFSPKRVESNGFASKCFWSFPSIESLRAKSLTIGDNSHIELGKLLGMLPLQKKMDFHYSSGSYDFHVNIQPITFNNITVQKYNAGPFSTESQKKRVERLNAKNARVDTALSHAIMMELDLREFNPPKDSLQQHFSELKTKEILLQERFSLG